jgi:hypothetical protein
MYPKAVRYICAGSAAVHRDAGAEGEDHEERAGQQLRHADDDPAGTG